MKDSTKVDIVIIGAGMVGQVLALQLARQKFKVAIVDNKQPTVAWPLELTARVSAINLASLNLLKQLNLTEQLDESSRASLQRLLVWDELGGGEIEFDSATLGVKELGQIVENRAILKAAYNELQNFSNVIWFDQDTPAALETVDQVIRVELESGQSIAASLCVGADGPNSWVRSQMQTNTEVRSYHQQAIIAVVETELPHQDTGWQVFLPTGPLALLPLAHPNQCAIVFSQDTERANQLLEMDELEFECELNNSFGVRLGHIKYLTDRRAFPLMMRHADNYVEPRLALVGDSAHTIHPLAGQGVNLGFADSAMLAAVLNNAKQKKQDLGSLKPLRQYARARRGDNSAMICTMRLFRDLFASQSTVAIQLRSQGLNLTNRMTVLKNYIMRQALGVT